MCLAVVCINDHLVVAILLLFRNEIFSKMFLVLSNRPGMLIIHRMYANETSRVFYIDIKKDSLINVWVCSVFNSMREGKRKREHWFWSFSYSHYVKRRVFEVKSCRLTRHINAEHITFKCDYSHFRIKKKRRHSIKVLFSAQMESMKSIYEWTEMKCGISILRVHKKFDCFVLINRLFFVFGFFQFTFLSFRRAPTTVYEIFYEFRLFSVLAISNLLAVLG